MPNGCGLSFPRSRSRSTRFGSAEPAFCSSFSASRLSSTGPSLSSFLIRFGHSCWNERKAILYKTSGYFSLCSRVEISLKRSTRDSIHSVIFASSLYFANEFVHPKSDRTAFYRVLSNQSVEPLDFNRIPKGSGIRETDIVYRQTRLPRDPYSLQTEHVDRVRKIVDDLIAELDRLLGGKLQKGDWLHNATWNGAYPVGSAFVPRQGGPAGGAA